MENLFFCLEREGSLLRWIGFDHDWLIPVHILILMCICPDSEVASLTGIKYKVVNNN